jgi:hypothetical protein
MKSPNPIIVSILIFLAILPVLLLDSGCASTSQTSTVIKSEGVLITTVDTGMRVWATYVNSGKASQSQVDAVKGAYNVYYTAQLASEAAIEKLITSGSTNTADITTANTSVLSAETALLNLLNQYIK